MKNNKDNYVEEGLRNMYDLGVKHAVELTLSMKNAGVYTDQEIVDKLIKGEKK